MTDLETLLTEITNEYHKQKDQLKVLKNATITSAISGFCYISFRFFGKRVHDKHALLNIVGIEALLLSILLIPLILAPLYIFMDDNIQNSIKSKVKYSIFKTSLDKYNLSYKICMKSKLPDIDIKNLGYEKKLLQFANGDDLIIGEVNHKIKFRISEIHSSTLVSKKFDGIVGVLIFTDNELQNIKFNLIKEMNSTDFELNSVSNKIYIAMHGGNSHFEFKFKREKPNLDKLLSDKKLFEDLCSVMFT
jgi:hypothetical protein